MSRARTTARVLALFAFVMLLGVLGVSGRAHAQSLTITQPVAQGQGAALFNGYIRGKANPGADVTYTLTPFIGNGNPVTGRVTAGADGVWRVKAPVMSGNWTLSVTSEGESVSTPVTWDEFLFQVWTSSSSFNTPVIPVGIMATRYWVPIDVTVQAVSPDGTPLGAPVFVPAGSSTFNWRPPTPASSTVTYRNILFEATDLSGNMTGRWLAEPITHTLGDNTGLQIELEQDGVVPTGSTTQSILVTVKLDGVAQPNVTVSFNGDEHTTGNDGTFSLPVPASSVSQTMEVTATLGQLSAHNWVTWLPPGKGAIHLVPFGPDGWPAAGKLLVVSGTTDEVDVPVGPTTGPVVVDAGSKNLTFRFVTPYGQTGEIPQTITVPDGKLITVRMYGDLIIPGAHDGRGIAQDYSIAGSVLPGGSITTVEYVFGDWETGTIRTAPVTAGGQFVLTGQLPNTPAAGTSVPVRIRGVGRPNSELAFTAVVDQTSPDAPLTSSASYFRGITYKLEGGIHDNLDWNTDHLMLQYTNDPTAPSPRWETMTLPATFDPSGHYSALWTPPQNGTVHDLTYRVAAVDYAGNQSAWSAQDTVTVHQLTLSLDPGNQTLSANADNQINVSARIDDDAAASQDPGTGETLKVSIGARSSVIDSDGLASFIVRPGTSDELVVFFEVAGQPVAAIPLFTPDETVHEGAAAFSVTGLFGELGDYNLRIINTDNGLVQEVQRLPGFKGTGLLLPAGCYEAIVTAQAPGVTGPAAYYLHKAFTVTEGAVTSVQLDARAGMASLQPTWTVQASEGGPLLTPVYLRVAVSPESTTLYLPPAELPANTEILAAPGSYVVRYDFGLGADAYSVVRSVATGPTPTALPIYTSGMLNLQVRAYDMDATRVGSLWLMDPVNPQLRVGADGLTTNLLHVESGTYNYEIGVDVPVEGMPNTTYHVIFRPRSGQQVTPTAGTIQLRAGGLVSLELETHDGDDYATVHPGDELEVTTSSYDNEINMVDRIVTETAFASGFGFFSEKRGLDLLLRVPDRSQQVLGTIGFHETDHVVAIPLDAVLTDRYDLTVEVPELYTFNTQWSTPHRIDLTVDPGMALVAQILPSPTSQSVNGNILPGETAKVALRYVPLKDPDYTLDEIKGFLETGAIVTDVQVAPELTGIVSATFTGSKVNLTSANDHLGLHLAPGATLLTATIQIPSPGDYGVSVDYSSLEVDVAGQKLTYALSATFTHQLTGALLGQVTADIGTPAAMSWMTGAPWPEVGQKFQVENPPAGPQKLVTMRAGYLPSEQTVPLDDTITSTTVHLTYGDVNGDQTVDTTDLDLMAKYVSQDPGLLPLDPGGDGTVSLKDLVAAARNINVASHPDNTTSSLTVNVTFMGAEPKEPYMGLYAKDSQGMATRAPVMVKAVSLTAQTDPVRYTGSVTFANLAPTKYQVNAAMTGWSCTEDGSDYPYDIEADLASVTSINVTCSPRLQVVVRHPGTSASQQFAVLRIESHWEGTSVSQYGYLWGSLYGTGPVVDPGSAHGDATVLTTYDGNGTEVLTVNYLSSDAITYAGVTNRSGGTIDPGTTLTVYYGDEMLAQKTAETASGEGSEWLVVGIGSYGGKPDVYMEPNTFTEFTDKPTVSGTGQTR